MKSNTQYFENVLREHKIYHSPASLVWYYDNIVFKGIDIDNKNVLDIGGGNGMISFYAALRRAARIDLLEPLSDGSGSMELDKYYKIKSMLPEVSSKIQLHNIMFQEYNAEIKYDIIVLHNSINHLNEDACINLRSRREAQKEYISYFLKMYAIMNPNGCIIFSDCSNRNFYNWLGITNPFAPEIDWHKHQNPETWIILLNKTGFVNAKTEWTSFKQLREPGRIFLANKVFSFFMASHFIIHAFKK